MSRPPIVSIIMANHNGAAFLPAALDSVRSQSLQDWELIAVDDASTDDSVRLLAAAAAEDPRIRLLLLPVNRGPGAARNRAIDEARGDWIAVLDSDDVMAPRRLERLIARAEAEDAAVIADNQTICDADLTPLRPFIPSHVAEALRRVDLAAFVDSGRLGAPVPDLGFLKPVVRAATLARSGARYDETLRIGEDFHFMARLLAGGLTLTVEPDSLYLYRKHDASISHRLSPAKVAAMIAADDAFARSAAPLGPAAVRALSRRRRSLTSVLAYERMVDAVKSGRLGRALAIVLSRPQAWLLMTRPLRVRLARNGLGLLAALKPNRPDSGPVGAPGAAGAPESAATDGVCVIIAAMNAGGTIARAVASALAERETTEVIVVDDASTDDTAAAARSADDGSGRLRILLHDSNLGPAAARNVAIAASEAPIVTVLDADDYWLPGRLARLVPHLAGCDLVADDLLRVVEGCEHVPPTALIGPELDGPFDLSLAHFAQANISRRGRARRELGFLKPLIRRAFLAQHGLTYDARLRLGEDFVLYAQALACGARFKLVPACGYVAVERAASLSGRHDIGDLQALLGACVALADAVGIGADAQSALARHRRHLRSKILHRRALDLRRRRGAAYALGLLSSDLRGAFYVVGEALIDRLARPRRANKITPSGTFGGTGVPAER